MTSPQRMKEIQEILESGAPLVKRIINVEAAVERDKARAAAQRNEYPRTGCPHPLEAIEQYIDDDPSTKRKGRATNLFECSLCHSLVWMVTPYGEAVSDGM